MKPENNTYSDLCVCCGEPIPEGGMVCRSCEIGNIKITPQKSTKPAKGFKKLFEFIKEFWNEP